jgi:hypothetical protein
MLILELQISITVSVREWNRKYRQSPVNSILLKSRSICKQNTQEPRFCEHSFLHCFNNTY